jgi:hypothetical protein
MNKPATIFLISISSVVFIVVVGPLPSAAFVRLPAFSGVAVPPFARLAGQG